MDALRGIPQKLQNDILEGLQVADQHEMTHLASGASILNKPMHLVFYESHFGRLASIHAMAHEDGLPPQDTLAELWMWSEFYQGLALGEVQISSTARIDKAKVSVSPIFQGHNFIFKSFFDEGSAKRYSRLAIGMYLHLLHDSFTRSHCVRDAEGNIQQFLCYRNQSFLEHTARDDVSPRHRKRLLRATTEALQALVIDKHRHDPTPLFQLSPQAKPSSNGGI